MKYFGAGYMLFTWPDLHKQTMAAVVSWYALWKRNTHTPVHTRHTHIHIPTTDSHSNCGFKVLLGKNKMVFLVTSCYIHSFILYSHDSHYHILANSAKLNNNKCGSFRPQAKLNSNNLGSFRPQKMSIHSIKRIYPQKCYSHDLNHNAQLHNSFFFFWQKRVNSCKYQSSLLHFGRPLKRLISLSMIVVISIE